MHEAEFAQRWAMTVTSQLPLEIAVAGGHLADDLAFVFIAGYQAAVRACFAIDDPGWVAYAVSERRDSAAADAPSSRVHVDIQRQTLSGVKSWVAAVEHITQLVIKVGDGGDAQYWRVATSAPGVSLEVRPAGQFLAAMSQGSAEFQQTPVEALTRLDALAARRFKFMEPVFIDIAFLAFVRTRAPGISQVDDLLTLGSVLVEADFSLPATAVQFAALDTGVQQVLIEFERLAATLPPESEIALPATWAQDRALLSMYSKGIQQRAQAAG
jgi:hypothetical protein